MSLHAILTLSSLYGVRLASIDRPRQKQFDSRLASDMICSQSLIKLMGNGTPKQASVEMSLVWLRRHTMCSQSLSFSISYSKSMASLLIEALISI